MMSCCASFRRRPRTAAVGLLGVACLLLPAPLPASRPDIVWMAGGHTDGVVCAYAPDGATIASGARDGTAKLWRVSDGACLRTVVAQSGGITSIAFSPDGQIVATGGEYPDPSVKLWRATTGQLLQTLPGHNRRVSALAFSRDGSLLASAGGYNDYSVKVWRVADGTLKDTFEGHSSIVSSVAFSPDARTVVSGSLDNTVRIWALVPGISSRTLLGHTARVMSVAFSPDGTILASGSFDKTAKLWRTSEWELVDTLPGQGLGVLSVAFQPSGETLAVANDYRSVDLWRLQDRQLLRTISVPDEGAESVVFAPDGESLATAGERSLDLWNVSDGTRIRRLVGDWGGISSVTYSPDGALIAAGGSYYSPDLHLWSVPERRLITALQGHRTGPSPVRFSPSGRLLASGGGYQSGLVKLWRVPEGELVRSLPTAWVIELAFSPDGSMIASGSADGTSSVWRVQDGTLVFHLVDQRAHQFSPDGSMLLTAGPPGAINLYRTADWALSLTIPTAADHFVLSPDGRVIAVGSPGGDVQLWSARDGRFLRTLHGHTDRVAALSFTPDSQLLATGSRDRTIRLWRVSDGALCLILDEETGTGIDSIGFSPDGKEFAYARYDATMVIARLRALSTAAARVSADGSPVVCQNLIVSAVFDGHFYAQEADRSSGIRVDHPTAGLIVGQRVRVEGAMGTNANGERFIAANSIAAAGAGEVQPLHVTGRALGGGDFGSPPRGQQGITGSFGLNNIGLLVATSGRVSAPRVPSGWFYLDDGSGVSDGTGIPGIYVDAGGLLTPPQGSFATVTGISSCEWFEGRLVNVLRARTQDDVRVHSSPGTPAAQVAGLQMQSNPRHNP